MAISEEIKECAKELFLEYNEDGDHKYSLQDIADIILQKFDNKLTKQSVSNWSKQFGWDILFQQGRNRGVEEAINESKAKEETITEAKSKETSKIYKQNQVKNEATGYLVIKILEYYAKQLQEEKITVEQLKDQLSLRELEYINRISFENMDKMDGNKKGNKVNDMFDKLNEMALEFGIAEFTDEKTV